MSEFDWPPETLHYEPEHVWLEPEPLYDPRIICPWEPALSRVMATRQGVRVLPAAVAKFGEVQARMEAAHGREKRRLKGVISSIEHCLGTDGVLRARTWYRQDSGRIQLRADEVQAVPKSLRFDIVPMESANVFVSCDLKAAHLSIACLWTGDTLLRDMASDPTAYDWLGAQLLGHVAPEHRRDAAKIATLALLNGGRPGGLAKATRGLEAAEAFYAYVMTRCPGLARLMEWAKTCTWSQGDAVPIPSLSKASTRYVRPSRRPGTLLSAVWTVTEAEAIDRALLSLPSTCRLVAPMYDGLLVACPQHVAAQVRVACAQAVAEGAQAAGFTTTVKSAIGATWAEAEGLTQIEPAPIA